MLKVIFHDCMALSVNKMSSPALCYIGYFLGDILVTHEMEKQITLLWLIIEKKLVRYIIHKCLV